MSNAGLAEIRALVDSGTSASAPQPGAILATLANDVFDPHYAGQLGRLYQESMALRFIVEANAGCGIRRVSSPAALSAVVSFTNPSGPGAMSEI